MVDYVSAYGLIACSGDAGTADGSLLYGMELHVTVGRKRAW